MKKRGTRKRVKRGGDMKGDTYVSFIRLEDITDDDEVAIEVKNELSEEIRKGRGQIGYDEILRNPKREVKIILWLEGRIICNLNFIPSDGYITWISCKKSTIKKPSYRLIKVAAAICKELGVEYMHLKVMADMNENFYRLYRHYHAIGFRCVARSEDIKGNKSLLYDKMEPLENFTNKAPTTYRNNIYNAWHFYCGRMLAKVEHILRVNVL